MSLQNRVTPFGELVAARERGTFMGNRGGRIHDPEARTLLPRRRFAGKRWICCRLEFKGRRRTVWGNGYTELFFHDEASALAAGHRPCHECRRMDARAFADAVRRAFALDKLPGTDWLDARLHAERLTTRGERPPVDPQAALPDGAVIASGETAFVMRGGEALPWIGFGWQEKPVSPALLRETFLVTPPTALGALHAGYRPRIILNGDGGD